jgi:mono/diheme cytochrome c family protein
LALQQCALTFLELVEATRPSAQRVRMNDQVSRGAILFWLIWLLTAQGACTEVQPTVAEGGSFYRANGCANCHGPTGRGDGAVGKTLTPPPRDFRDASAFKNGAGVSAIAATLSEGLTKDGGQMPKFDHLTAHERQSIALFVISLRESSNDSKKGTDRP